MGHFVSSPREREKRDRKDRGDERDREERGEMKESEGTEEITTFPHYTYLLQGPEQALPNFKPISVERPGDKSYRTPLPHPTSPRSN